MVGKSTLLSIFVYFLSCQWLRLAKQHFDTASIEFPSGETVAVSRSDCVDFSLVEMPTRFQQLALTLADEGVLDSLLDGGSLAELDLPSLANRTSLSERDLRTVRVNLLQYGQASKSLALLSSCAKVIRRSFKGTIVYLPTYRRIEQDLTELFSMSPTLMRRIQLEIQESLSQAPQDVAEIARFGMEDID